jgi:RNA polymerase sigma-70 factor, ECF subfamily
VRPGESSEAPTTLAHFPDADLVARAQQGEEGAFTSLFLAHKRSVYSVCLRMTHSPADAEDLTQEAFLQVFRKLATFRGESTFSTWLHRVTVNLVLMHLRKKRLPQVSLDEVDSSREEPATREYRDDDQRLMATVDRINLSEAIAHLPRGYRTALVLFDLEGYDHSEIARMMNWSVGNSKSQLHKARRKLRDWLRLQGETACSMNRAKARPKDQARKNSALRDRTGVRGMNRLEPFIWAPSI